MRVWQPSKLDSSYMCPWLSIGYRESTSKFAQKPIRVGCISCLCRRHETFAHLRTDERIPSLHTTGALRSSEGDKLREGTSADAGLQRHIRISQFATNWCTYVPLRVHVQPRGVHAIRNRMFRLLLRPAMGPRMASLAGGRIGLRGSSLPRRKFGVVGAPISVAETKCASPLLPNIGVHCVVLERSRKA